MRIDLQQEASPNPARRFLLIALTIVAVWQVQRAFSLREEWEMLAADSDLATAEEATGAPVNLDQQTELVRIRGELHTPWEPMLDAILDNAGPEVHLLSIRPDVMTARVEVSGTATSRSAYLDYAARLHRDVRAGDAFPLGDEPSDNGVAFRLQAGWGNQP